MIENPKIINMVKKTVKYLYYFLHILLIGILIFLCFSSNYYREKIYSRLLPILILFSVINMILIFLSKKSRKKYFFHICYEILEFLIINTALALIIGAIIWVRRDKALIEAANIWKFTFLYVFINIFFTTSLISYIITLLLNIKKSFKIDRNIFILLFPVKSFILFLLYLTTWFAIDTICPWDPLIDTYHSDTFNIYNIDKIETGMTKEKVTELIGDPLYARTDEEGTGKLEFTNDGKYHEAMKKSQYGDYSWYGIGGGYAWFHFDLEFKNNILIDIESFWAHD